MEYIKVKDKINLARDSYSNGIVNTDYKAYSQYINTYSQKINENKKIESMKKDIDDIRGDLDEIKNLLKNLLGSNSEAK